MTSSILFFNKKYAQPRSREKDIVNLKTFFLIVTGRRAACCINKKRDNREALALYKC
jgi:hypothetical protein